MTVIEVVIETNIKFVYMQSFSLWRKI